MKSPNQNAFDQFTLRSLFLFVSVLAVCFVMIRVGLQLGIFTRPDMAAIGCVTVLALVKWLLMDHEWRIEQGQRKPFDIASVALFLTISGLVAMFFWLLPNAATWAIPFFTAATLSLETSPVSFLVGSFGWVSEPNILSDSDVACPAHFPNHPPTDTRDTNK